LVRQVGLLWLAAVIDRVGHLGRERRPATASIAPDRRKSDTLRPSPGNSASRTTRKSSPSDPSYKESAAAGDRPWVLAGRHGCERSAYRGEG